MFSFNYWLRNASEAEAHCNRQGGHLASYASMLEQSEVEQAFIAGVSCLNAAGKQLFIAVARYWFLGQGSAPASFVHVHILRRAT